jgi:hypothetical protein
MDADTLQSLLNSSSSSSSNSLSSLIDINAIIQSLIPYLIALTVVSILLTILYLISIIQKMRANKAILETRDILREMNERDRARGSAPTQSKGATPTGTALQV